VLLARAFQDDPLFRVVLPHAARRRRVSEWLHDRMLRYCLAYGVAHTTPALEGVACWLPPGRTELSTWAIARSGLLAMPLRMGPAAFARFRAYLSCSSRVRRREAPDSYWYLWALGVDPPYQGKGVGRRLLRPILDQADASATPCYLETENATNLAFYERHGFRVVAEEKVPGLGLSTWSMVRNLVRD
jgi:ribosomal protein S18 acetylase RimI-like enzyme